MHLEALILTLIKKKKLKLGYGTQKFHVSSHDLARPPNSLNIFIIRSLLYWWPLTWNFLNQNILRIKENLDIIIWPYIWSYCPSWKYPFSRVLIPITNHILKAWTINLQLHFANHLSVHCERDKRRSATTRLHRGFRDYEQVVPWNDYTWEILIGD